MDCSHEVQYQGLCACCGKVLDSSEVNRDNINMTHDSMNLTVSRKEAERLEHENTNRLLHERKLSLILDLDQTVVHATWDPTVGDWMNDENNTNHPATKDIRKFTLPGSSLMYYIKLRPGLSEFLEQVSKLYEFHIYTMGTRHYAEAVAHEIDPENKLFRGRVLSRDESGSITQKKIQRLFPCDTSMVVALDDRSDVWSFSPNLIKIKPYEFFVGIGDINSPFSPKQIPDMPPPPPVAAPAPAPAPATDTSADGSSVPVVDKKDDDDNQDDEQNMLDEQEDKDEEKKLLAQQERLQEEMAIEQQQQRPLAQKQNELAPDQERPLLVDNDKELYTMAKILVEVHRRYYDQMDIYNQYGDDNNENGAGSPSKRPDVKDLIPDMKKQVLKGVYAVFSGLIPQQQALPSSAYWQQAEAFGAVCSPDLTGKVTHVIAAKAGTDKVKRARMSSRIHIVTVDWLLDSVARWKRQDESQYTLPSFDPPGGAAVESEIENPESTPFDDGAFDPDEHGLVEDIDWDEADREVDDAINESGTDVWDTDSEAVESPSSSQQTPRKGKRSRQFNESDSSGNDDDESDDGNKSPLARRRMTAAKRGRSQLSQVSTLIDNEDEGEGEQQQKQLDAVARQEDDDDEDHDKDGISTGGNTSEDELDYPGYEDEGTSDQGDSDLDDFAGMLDGEID